MKPVKTKSTGGDKPTLTNTPQRNIPTPEPEEHFVQAWFLTEASERSLSGLDANINLVEPREEVHPSKEAMEVHPTFRDEFMTGYGELFEMRGGREVLERAVQICVIRSVG